MSQDDEVADTMAAEADTAATIVEEEEDTGATTIEEDTVETDIRMGITMVTTTGTTITEVAEATTIVKADSPETTLAEVAWEAGEEVAAAEVAAEAEAAAMAIGQES